MKLKLLTLNNLKLQKNADGLLPAILHLAPAKESGFNTCPLHTAECARACIHWTGHGRLTVVQNARIRRTRLYFLDRDTFLEQLCDDIRTVIKAATRDDLIPAFRLNGTSDIRWENHGIPQQFNSVQFWDYTKMFNRKVPTNYHLTYSFSGYNLKECLTELAAGHNVAVAFLKRPATWMGYPVVDGDADDWRFLNQSPCIIGLKAKGTLRKDTTSLFLGDNHNG
jgi:hypothetical protein